MRKEEPRNEDASDGDEREGRRVRRARNAGIVLVATFAPESRVHRTRRSRVSLQSRPARPGAVVSTLTPRRFGCSHAPTPWCSHAPTPWCSHASARLVDPLRRRSARLGLSLFSEPDVSRRLAISVQRAEKIDDASSRLVPLRRQHLAVREPLHPQHVRRVSRQQVRRDRVRVEDGVPGVYHGERARRHVLCPRAHPEPPKLPTQRHRARELARDAPIPREREGEPRHQPRAFAPRRREESARTPPRSPRDPRRRRAPPRRRRAFAAPAGRNPHISLHLSSS